MRRALLIVLLGTSLLVPALLHAADATYRYDGVHAHVAEGVASFCYERGLHRHEAPPADRTAFNRVDGVRHFIADPITAGADPTRVEVYRFHGSHPIPRAVGGGVCGLEGFHHHTWPPETLSVGTWHWEHGAWAWGYPSTPVAIGPAGEDSTRSTRWELVCPLHYPRSTPGAPPSTSIPAGTPIDLPPGEAPVAEAPVEEELELPSVLERAWVPMSPDLWISGPGWPALPITSRADIEREELLVWAETLTAGAGDADATESRHIDHAYDAPVVRTWGARAATPARSSRSGDAYRSDSASSSSSRDSSGSSSGDSSRAKSAWSGKSSGGRDSAASGSSSRYSSKKR